MKTLHIMRGLPGSGKSTKAKELAMGGPICSADSFMLDANGNYHFAPERLTDAHWGCYDKACWAMDDGEPIVVVDNTNTTKREFEMYVEAARQRGYKVVFEVVGNRTDLELYAKRNIHGCPLETIKRMAARWED